MKLSYYYKYNFVSPEPIYAEIKEELRSYFATGVVDDVLFGKYTEDCLKKFGKSVYKIEENILKLEDFQATLPDNFKSVRELWLVAPAQVSYRMPNACYEQATIKVSSDRDRCKDFCAPEEVKVTYKTTGTIIQRFQCSHLLTPGNVNAQKFCSDDSWNIGADSLESFDIRGNKIITNFPEGSLYLVYYAEDFDENQNNMIPDHEAVQDYIKSYLKYKCFETISNNIFDETARQIESKRDYYERKADEALIIARTELKMQTAEQVIRATKYARRRFNKYKIS